MSAEPSPTARWFLFDPYENGETLFDTEAEALSHANILIEQSLEDGCWDESVESIIVGRVTHHVVKTVLGRRSDMAADEWESLAGARSTEVDEWWDFAIVPAAVRGETA